MAGHVAKLETCNGSPASISTSGGAAAPSEPLILKAWVAKRADAAPAPAATAPPLPATNDDDDARWLANLVKAEMQN